MNDSRFTQWLSIGANLAVFVGLILLVYELNQTRELTKAQIRDEMSDGIFDLFMHTAGNEQLADVLVRGNAGEELSPSEQFQFQSRTRAMFRYFENVNYQYRMGLYERPEYERQTRAWQNYLAISPAAVDVWCSYRETVSAEAEKEIDSLLTTYTCDD
ncbi:MAG: hypothetical protein R3358_08215 [Woeseiaceae bacterium]|nr:hypothetical protein [Woeseiaceae bacterium]